MRVKFIPFVFLSLACFSLLAQSDTGLSTAALKKLSLEELMNVQIYTVSKTEEFQFDAPLSSTVITRDEIRRAGCTTIMEALRLAPGVIVREQTNGNYDIHIRGLDNVPPNSGMYFFTNSTTLVMIDNRPVYNYVQGGTFWHTLPIDLNDVEKIEVVRGPAAAMYGPNAESGVINIITRQPEKKGPYIVANAQGGNYATAIVNGSVGYRVKDKFSAVVSGNFQNRNRTMDNYYDVGTDRFVPVDSFIATFLPHDTAGMLIDTTGASIDSLRDLRYPHPYLAMRKYGYNAFLRYDINDRAFISVQGGGENSEVQNEFASNYLTMALSKSYYVNMRAGIYGANVQASYLTGMQSPQGGNGGWDFNVTDVVLDYNMTAVKHLVITPGVSYRRAAYDDRKYVNEAIREGGFNREVLATTISGLLRADWKIFHEKLRLLASGRMDKFNAPSKIYWSWNFAVTYKLHENHLLRVTESRANQCPLLLNNYFDYLLTTPAFSIQLLGNTNMQLITTDMLELGYRGKIRDNLEVDIEVFGSDTKNFMTENLTRVEVDTTTGLPSYIYTFQNIPLVVRQYGATISVNYIAGKVQFKPFITVQHTTLFNYSPSNFLPVILFFNTPVASAANTHSGVGTQMKHVGTPTVYGGAYINFEITPHLNVNVNPYFMSASTQTSDDNIKYNDGSRGIEKIAPKLIMNVVVAYSFFKQHKLTLFGNFKNCFNLGTREFYRADVPGFKVTGGVHFEF